MPTEAPRLGVSVERPVAALGPQFGHEHRRTSAEGSAISPNRVCILLGEHRGAGRLTAILAADVVGSSRLMAADENVLARPTGPHRTVLAAVRSGRWVEGGLAVTRTFRFSGALHRRIERPLPTFQSPLQRALQLRRASSQAPSRRDVPVALSSWYRQGRRRFPC